MGSRRDSWHRCTALWSNTWSLTVDPLQSDAAHMQKVGLQPTERAVQVPRPNTTASVDALKPGPCCFCTPLQQCLKVPMYGTYLVQ